MDVAPDMQWISIDAVHPWDRNPRRNEKAAAKLVKLLRKMAPDGNFRRIWTSPIAVQADSMRIVAGHTRWKAATRLGMPELPVKVLDINDTEAAELALADNRIGEEAEWDDEMLRALSAEYELDLTELGWSDEEAAELLGGEGEGDGDKEQPYSRKIEAPIYEPTSPTAPPLVALTHTEKRDALIAEIMAAEVPAEVEAFLVAAAHRHTVFEYGKIAEYYAHAPPDVQELMERSALVIIDFDAAIEGGFVRLSKQLAELAGLEGARG
jgi:hypothetical protein